MGAPTTPYRPYADVHEDPQGAGDARPTALQIVQDEGIEGKLTDKVIIITGCSAGIGIETARALHATGAKLFLTVRSEAKGKPVIDDILKTSQSKTPIELLIVDLSSLDSVRAAAKHFLSRSKTLNILINNAGVMASPETKTVDGFELQMGTNHFGHFLFFQLLKPTLLASSTPSFHSRVVNVSSSGHRMSPIRFDDMDFAKDGYDNWTAYGQSKTANIYMANSIEAHYGSKGLHGLSMHPGVILDTELSRHLSQADFDRIGGPAAFQKVGKSASQGAATQTWCAIARHFEGKGGVYCADVGEAPPKQNSEGPGGQGYAPHAYDDEAAERLWRLSYPAVGLKNED